MVSYNTMGQQKKNFGDRVPLDQLEMTEIYSFVKITLFEEGFASVYYGIL